MHSNYYASFSRKELARRIRLSTLVLIAVWAGATFAIIASLYQYVLGTAFPTETFVVSILALLASIPLIYERRRISAFLSID